MDDQVMGFYVVQLNVKQKAVCLEAKQRNSMVSFFLFQCVEDVFKYLLQSSNYLSGDNLWNLFKKGSTWFAFEPCCDLTLSAEEWRRWMIKIQAVEV